MRATTVPDFAPAASKHPALAAAWAYSRATVAQMIAQLERHRPQLGAIETVAVGGSLGRLEAHRHSDFDCLIIATDDADETTVAAQTAKLLDYLARCGLKPPKAGGIYRKALRRHALIDTDALGSLDEAPAIFGQRMQLLLDAHAIYNPAACRSLQEAILRWYGSGFHAENPGASWTYLINDLGRYRHAYCAWQQYKFERTIDDSWQLRQAKLRSSRMITFAGLNFLIGMTNHSAEKLPQLLEMLRLTPMERLNTVMQIYDPDAFGTLLDAYECVQQKLSDHNARRELVAGGPSSSQELTQSPNEVYGYIQQHTQRIMTTLTDFLLDRRNDWDPRFFARLLF